MRDDRHSFLLGAMVWVMVTLMVIPEGFDYTHVAPAGSPVTRLLWLSIVGISGVVIVWRAALGWLLLGRINAFLWLFAALAVASIFWSIAPEITAKRAVRFGTIVLAAIAFVLVGWHRQRFQTVLRGIVTVLLTASLAAGLLFPSFAIHQSSLAELRGAWHGVAAGKNGLGALACMGAILWFHAWLVREARLPAALFGGAVSLACLVLSRSSTSLMTALFVATFLLLLLRSPPSLRRFMPYIIVLFVVALLSYSIAILHLVPALDFLLEPIPLLTGKDLTFSSRSEIWQIIIQHIRLSPWLGTGYCAYWIGPVITSPSYEFVVRMYFYPNSAHNGYLDIINDLGIAGLACLAGYIVLYLRQCLRLLQIDRAQAALYLGLFLDQGITNLSETHWLCVLSLDFVVMTLATAALARSDLEWRLRYYFGEASVMQYRPLNIAVHVPRERERSMSINVT